MTDVLDTDLDYDQFSYKCSHSFTILIRLNFSYISQGGSWIFIYGPIIF